MVFLDFIEQRTIAHIEQPSRRFPVPVRLFERFRYGGPLRLPLRIPHQQFQRRALFSQVPIRGRPVARLAISAVPVFRRNSVCRTRLQFPHGSFFIRLRQVALGKTFQFPQISRPGVVLANIQQTR